MAEDKKDALLASIGGKTFTLLRSLTAPGKPGDKQYGELVELPRKHLNQKPIVISERFRFFKRDQQERASNNTRLSFKNSRSIAILDLC